MKFLHIPVLILLLLSFNFVVKAQFCVQITRFDVRDDTGKIIEPAAVEFSPLDKTRTIPKFSKDGDFYGWGEMGIKYKSRDFILKVSAPGYEDFEQKINLDFCAIQSYEVKLKFNGSNSKASFERLSNISGRVIDVNGKPIEDVDIKAVTTDGRVYKAHSNNAGFYGLDLPEGEFEVQFSSSKFTNSIFSNLKVKAGNNPMFESQICFQCK